MACDYNSSQLSSVYSDLACVYHLLFLISVLHHNLDSHIFITAAKNRKQCRLTYSDKFTVVYSISS